MSEKSSPRVIHCVSPQQQSRYKTTRELQKGSTYTVMALAKKSNISNCVVSASYLELAAVLPELALVKLLSTALDMTVDLPTGYEQNN